jgi:hypothetical protein
MHKGDKRIRPAWDMQAPGETDRRNAHVPTFRLLPNFTCFFVWIGTAHGCRPLFETHKRALGRNEVAGLKIDAAVSSPLLIHVNKQQARAAALRMGLDHGERG